MSSQPMRDPALDHLLTPENAALVIIDYQPIQVRSIRSMDQGLMIRNAVGVAKLARLFRMPVLISTVNVTSGGGEPTIPEITDVLSDAPIVDRTTINAWEDIGFVEAIKATRRRKLVMAALWTEACLTFPTLDAIRDGYEIYPIVDALGGTSVEAHRAGLARVTSAGAQLTSFAQFACELQRDWSRTATSTAFADILFTRLDA